MKRVLVLLVLGTLVSGVAAYAGTSGAKPKPAAARPEK
jgi:hypothetical protein